MDPAQALVIISNTIPELQAEVKEQLYRASKYTAKQAKLAAASAQFAYQQAQLAADSALSNAKNMQMALYEEITLTSEDL